MSGADEFPEKFVAGIIGHINEDHRRELLDIAHGIAQVGWADDASLQHFDKEGLDIALTGDNRRQIVRVRFDTPLSKTTQFRPAMIALIGQARQALPGASSQAVMD